MTIDLCTLATQGSHGRARDRIVALAMHGQYDLFKYNPRKITVRGESSLTTSYVASDIINIYGKNQLQLMVSFTKGESEGCRLKIEFSEDGIDWYQETWCEIDTESSDVIYEPAVRNITETGDYLICIPVWAWFFRISALAITSAIDTSLSIVAVADNIYS